MSNVGFSVKNSDKILKQTTFSSYYAHSAPDSTAHTHTYTKQTSKNTCMHPRPCVLCGGHVTRGTPPKNIRPAVATLKINARHAR